MNIHINKELHDYLQSIKLFEIKFGSHLKGKSNDSSDSDILVIVKSHKAVVSAPLYTNHLLQYKGDNVDYVYVSEVQFFHNIVNAESAIFHEILRYNALNNTPFQFLNKINFLTHDTLKCYLGLMKRDLKASSANFKDKKVAKKKFQFFVESYLYLSSTLLDLGVGHSEFSDNYTEFSESIDHNQIIIKAMRQKLNDLWLEGRIKKTISLNDLMLITDYLNNIELLPNNQYSDIILGIYLKEIQNENCTML